MFTLDKGRIALPTVIHSFDQWGRKKKAEGAQICKHTKGE